jgi:hypothetical protein
MFAKHLKGEVSRFFIINRNINALGDVGSQQSDPDLLYMGIVVNEQSD